MKVVAFVWTIALAYWTTVRGQDAEVEPQALCDKKDPRCFHQPPCDCLITKEIKYATGSSDYQIDLKIPQDPDGELCTHNVPRKALLGSGDKLNAKCYDTQMKHVLNISLSALTKQTCGQWMIKRVSFTGESILTTTLLVDGKPTEKPTEASGVSSKGTRTTTFGSKLSEFGSSVQIKITPTRNTFCLYDLKVVACCCQLPTTTTTTTTTTPTTTTTTPTTTTTTPPLTTPIFENLCKPSSLSVTDLDLTYQNLQCSLIETTTVYKYQCNGTCPGDGDVGIAKVVEGTAVPTDTSSKQCHCCSATSGAWEYHAVCCCPPNTPPNTRCNGRQRKLMNLAIYRIQTCDCVQCSRVSPPARVLEDW